MAFFRPFGSRWDSIFDNALPISNREEMGSSRLEVDGTQSLITHYLHSNREEMDHRFSPQMVILDHCVCAVLRRKRNCIACCATKGYAWHHHQQAICYILPLYIRS